MKRLNQARILMYSHDTFGLGHLRRCRTIAHALVERFKGLSVLIISGSQIAGAFDFKARVDFVKIPSVIKLRNGEYTSIDEHIDIQETLDMRASMILHTAQTFKPDIFIVDKEPLGLRGELEETLKFLSGKNCKLVLGLRDVMDAPERLMAEWERKNLLEKTDQYYDSIWVYGTEDFWNPLKGFDLSESFRNRMVYTGFLDRTMPAKSASGVDDYGAFILVTAGGGGDGADLFDNVLSAYEYQSDIGLNAVLVLGPFMPTEDREEITARAAELPNVFVIDFEANIERLMASCRGLVGMCGYNTFCELISFDKRGLVVPRLEPRMEQFVRARRAMEIGLLDVMSEQEAGDPATMAKALEDLPRRPKPSEIRSDRMLCGLDTIADLTESLLADLEDAGGFSGLSLVRN